MTIERFAGIDEDCDGCLNKRDEIERMTNALDALGIAIADAGYEWTPAMRKAYESGRPGHE